jgi:GNAT superfamily N-acetyltransferase
MSRQGRFIGYIKAMSGASPDGVTVRPLQPADSISDVTRLLHRAYASLAAQGFRFWASHQSDENTRQRIAEGDCLVALQEGRIVGTITLKKKALTKGSPWYDRPEVASFGQFAVDPELQRRGIGSTLLGAVERLAVREGVQELALDTAEGAAPLIEMYSRKGFRFIEYVDWRPDTNYRSVILSKRLDARAFIP